MRDTEAETVAGGVFAQQQQQQRQAGGQGKKPSAFRRFLRVVWRFIKRQASIREDTDVQATIESISRSVEFKGVNFWILAFAIIVASVGLNVNSTAVIIGAMLISPLMGPINGIGLAIGILDDELLKKSLTNILIMVVVSLLASTLYFLLSPLSDAQSELLARTRPTIYDVLIAFFCGLAGMVATSRKSQPMGIIAGVAIATALMPPLCTAGYGLATGQLKYFFGAFYLFFINSFFISLATFIMVRYLGFPERKHADPQKHRTVKRLVTVFTVIVLVPSLIMAVNVVREAAFNSEAIRFVNEIQNTEYFKNVQLINSSRDFGRKDQNITLSVVGKPLTEMQIREMQDMVHTKYKLTNTRLIVRQTGQIVDVTKQHEIIENLIEKKELAIAQKDSVISDLQQQLSNAQYESDRTCLIVKELHALYPDIENVSVANMVSYDTRTMRPEAVPVLYLQWRDDSSDHSETETKITEWLSVRLNVDSLKVIH